MGGWQTQSDFCSPCSTGSVKCPGPGKSEWPELLGAKVMDAKATIEIENPSVIVHPIACDAIRVLDCCCNRVWLNYSEEFGTVCTVPKIG
ncbi:hypothetical protein QJS10_CPB21g01440 [Acorus calamus]|uniref:Uncharacterized protein n=1 Tax=Acorus calamus TaxID=4465 RepID=A0AAV9C5N9_ACOCL|nr:hypothetical protein QJS10_CPB21g01440 [Acorus calamus]